MKRAVLLGIGLLAVYAVWRSAQAQQPIQQSTMDTPVVPTLPESIDSFMSRLFPPTERAPVEEPLYELPLTGTIWAPVPGGIPGL